jgi:hypothetical protein
MNPFDRGEKELIKKFLKEGKVDIRHLNDIKGAFLTCDEEKLGKIMKKDLIYKLYLMNLQFPSEFFMSFIEMI